MSRPEKSAISSPSAAEAAGIAAHCRDLLAPLGTVRIRRMFGGHGIYLDDLFIAIIAAGTLYLKTDATSVERFRDAGCRPFEYETRDGRHTMSYWSAPEEAMETPEAMAPWALLASDSARRAAAASAGRQRRRRS
ncbi:TfoX/Sxy family protein [Piscinibacter sakaiensis]|uniref:TfoX/Sxy family protein n=1 Tax=Piscinibacter sakaiensis TaxID=1547922 RepID=UPI003AAF5713